MDTIEIIGIFSWSFVTIFTLISLGFSKYRDYAEEITELSHEILNLYSFSEEDVGKRIYPIEIEENKVLIKIGKFGIPVWFSKTGGLNKLKINSSVEYTLAFKKNQGYFIKVFEPENIPGYRHTKIKL